MAGRQDAPGFSHLAPPAAHAAMLAILGDAEIAAPPGLDGAQLWDDLRSAFNKAEMWEAAEAPLLIPGIEALAAYQRAALALADAAGALSDHPLARRALRDAGRARTAQDQCTSRTQGEPSPAIQAQDFAQTDGTAAVLAAIAADARGRAEALHKQGPAWPKEAGRNADAYLIAHELPVVFRQHLKAKATYTPASGTTRTSAFLRFARAAFIQAGRVLLTDDAMMQAQRRWHPRN